MGIFKKLIRNSIEVVVLPAKVVRDVVMFIPDAGEKRPFDSTRNGLEDIKDRAEEILKELDE